MHIAIIGAGFTGLTAAFELQKQGVRVTIFEKDDKPGGLAIGFKKDTWNWSLEKHYHHIFTSDTAIRTLADEVGVPFLFKRPITSSLVEGDILQLDSPVKLLQFSKLSYAERIRMGAVLAYLKYVASWEQLEGYRADVWLSEKLGKRPYELIWKPLFMAKFGPYFHDISLSWFWARIRARTTQLGYPEGGFQHLAERVAHQVETRGGEIRYNTGVERIASVPGKVMLTSGTVTEQFDAVLVTVPNILFDRMATSLPSDYTQKLRSFKGIGAVNMVLELDAPFLSDQVYWLNICDRSYPFVAVVEHTHFIDKKEYGNTHLLYVGNYLPADHAYFSLSEDELHDVYRPHLKKLKSDYETHVKAIHVFKVPFAQPIVTRNFSRQILPFETPLAHVYLANMQQVYPWDRGTNFAVDLGQRVAQFITNASR